MNKSIYTPKIQAQIDSIFENLSQDPAATLDTCTDLIREGVRMEDTALIGFGYFYSGNVYYALNEGDLFFETITKALSYLSIAGEWELMARSYNLLGIQSVNNANIPLALDYYSKGMELCQQHHLDKVSVILWVNISSMYMSCKWYEDAIRYAELAYDYMSGRSEDPAYVRIMFAIIHNIEKCMVVKGDFAKVEKLRKEVHDKLWDRADDVDRMIMYFVEAFYFDKCGKEEDRNAVITWVDEHLSDNIPAMDLVDDFYDYSRLLINCDKKAEFWHLIGVMDTATGNLNLINILLQEVSLKIQFYRKNKERENYLEASGRYYELSEQMESERMRMNSKVINLRRSLDQAKKKEQAMEAENQMLLQRSQTDALTKLGNRFQLNDYFERVYQKALIKRVPIAIEILDVDYFKEYNDNYGHQSGDTCLVTVANVLEYMKRWHNVYCARYGGDEFIVVYQNQSQQEVLDNAARIRQKLEAADLEHQFSKAGTKVTLSQGICWGIPDGSSRMWDYLHTADDMLYHVKNAGRNNYCFCEIDNPEDYVMGEKR